MRTSGAVRVIRGAFVSLCKSKAERGVGHSVYERSRTAGKSRRTLVLQQLSTSGAVHALVTPSPCLQVSDTAAVSLSTAGSGQYRWSSSRDSSTAGVGRCRWTSSRDSSTRRRIVLTRVREEADGV